METHMRTEAFIIIITTMIFPGKNGERQIK